jgi:TonB-linked SusC/RagA family outer membrane protein
MRRKPTLLILALVLISQYLAAQQRTVTGVITDENNEPLIGVTVVIVGTTTGAVTDLDGRYSVQVRPGEQLQFSFVGMQTRIFDVTDQTTTIDVQLMPSTEELEEIVVVGYGTQKKESVVGAITQTAGENLKRNFQGSNLADNLNGLMPGVVSIRSSGVPGGAPLINATGKDDHETQVFIRGQTTWNGGEPLVLVDGVERSLMDVDPNEIDNISVLKDASATAVFGVRGADGVILITTKRGKVGKPVLTFESVVTAGTLSKLPHNLNSYDVNFLKDMAIEYGLAADESSWSAYVPWQVLQYYKTQEYPELYPDVDWRNAMSRDYAWDQRYNLGVRGGTDFVKYFLSLGYLRQGDIMNLSDRGQGYDPSFGYDRFNFRSNFDFDITRSTKFSMNLTGIYGAKKTPGVNDRSQLWKGFYDNPPDMFPIQYPDGIYGHSDQFTTFTNTVYTGNFLGLDRNNRSEINTDFILNQKLDAITQGLSVNVKTSFDNFTFTTGPNIVDEGMVRKYVSPSILDARNAADSANAVIYKYPSTPSHGYNYVSQPIQVGAEHVDNDNTRNVSRHFYYEVSLNYSRNFKDHAVTGLFLFNRDQFARGSSFPSYREGWVGRTTYNYRGKYFFEFNGAYNGSEKFDREYRFGFFPSFAGGWMLSNEKFFQSALPFVNTFKLRYSWGTTGNDANIARWQYVSSWDKTNQTRPFGSPVTQPGFPFYFEGTVANPNVHWEIATKQDVGLEAGIFKNLVSLSFDYYWEHRTDMFITASDRANNVIFGAEPPSANLGELKSNGWELELNLSKAWSSSRFWAKYNLAFTNSDVIFQDDPQLKPDYQKQAGYPIGQTRTQISSGIIQSWDEMYTGVGLDDNTFYLPGDYRLVDYNADGVINENDVVPYGYTYTPKYSYGITLGYDYRGFGVQAQFYGVFDVSGTYNWYNEFVQNYDIAYPFQLDGSWATELGRTSGDLYPHVRYNYFSPKGEYYVWDYSYFKLQNAQVSYTFSGNVLKSTGVDELRIYCTVSNVLIWNKLLEDRDRPMDVNSQFEYPLLRRYGLGLSITF